MKAKYRIFQIRMIDSRGNQKDYLLSTGKHPDGKYDLDIEFETEEEAETYLSKVKNYLLGMPVILKVYKGLIFLLCLDII
jgi:hypothetical protein